jgi:hypothetical protein
MRAAATPPDERAGDDVPDLFGGGLLYRLAMRFGVPPADALVTARRAVVLALLLWVPAAVLALIEGHFLPGSVKVPFLLDVAAYARPLLVIPLFVMARPIHAVAWQRSGRLLHERGLVGPEIRPAYDALVGRVRRLVRWTLPDLLCLGLGALLTAKLLGVVRSEPRDTWFAVSDVQGGTRITWAGWWSAVVVHTLVFAWTLRWLWLYGLWYRFLFGVSRLALSLHPAHPDRAAGLGLLGRSMGAAAPIVAAWSTGAACGAANAMLFHGAPLATFIPLGITLLATVLVVYVLPLVVLFAPLLVRTRRDALELLGRRLGRAGDLLERRGPAQGGEEPESLEELQIAVDAVRAILPIPFAPGQLAPLLAAAALPAVPLLLLAVPFSEVLERLLDLLI